MRILVLITALLWAGVSGWWYTCNIKGYCDADPKEINRVNHVSSDRTNTNSATETSLTEAVLKDTDENDATSNDDNISETTVETDNAEKSKLDDTVAKTSVDNTKPQQESTTSEADNTETSDNEEDNETTEIDINEDTKLEDDISSSTDTDNTDDNKTALESAVDDAIVDETQPNPLEEDIPAEDDDDETKIKIDRVSNAYNDTDVVPTIKKVRIYSPSNISKQTELNTNASRYFDTVIAMLKADATLEITLTGYTDSKGGAARNKTLGLRRANTLKDILVANGAPANQISTDSRGEENPVWSNKSEAGRKKNRRVELESRNKEE